MSSFDEERTMHYGDYFTYSLLEIDYSGEITYYNCMMIKDALSYKKGQKLRYIVIGPNYKINSEWVNHHS